MRGEGGAESDEGTTMAQRQSMDSTRAHSSLYYFMILIDLYYGILSREEPLKTPNLRRALIAKYLYCREWY